MNTNLLLLYVKYTVKTVPKKMFYYSEFRTFLLTVRVSESFHKFCLIIFYQLDNRGNEFPVYKT